MRKERRPDADRGASFLPRKEIEGKCAAIPVRGEEGIERRYTTEREVLT